MDTGFLKVAAVSPKVAVADVQTNLKTAIEVFKEAKQKKIGILVFPELFLSGATVADLALQSVLLTACEDAIAELCKESADSETVLCIGSPMLFNMKLYDCAVLIQNGKILSVIPKTYLNASNSNGRNFASGFGIRGTLTLCNQEVSFGQSVIKLSNKAILGVEIGEDMLSPLSPSVQACASGANVIATLSAIPAAVSKQEYVKMLLQTESAKTASARIFASAGSLESTTDFVFSGLCAIAENGTILEESNVFSQEAEIAVADIDLDKLLADKIKQVNLPVFNPSLTLPLLSASKDLQSLKEEDISRTFSPLVFLPQDEATAKKHAEEILSMQSAALAKRMQHIGCKKLVLGLSGGLDSTLALLVSIRTLHRLQLPNENLHCVTLPGFGTTDRTYQNALALAKGFGCTLSEISIAKATLLHFEDIGHDKDVRNAAYENAQARERTQILMDLANEESALLVGTGDLSELALGWCTFNADHMSMYGVNADVPKTLVQYLVQYEAGHVKKELADILLDVVATPISPELLPPDENGNIEQKTETTLGPYEVHDFYLYYFLRFGFAPEKLLFMAKRAFENKYTNAELETWLRTFIKRFFTNQFKRSCLPDGPKVGSVGISPRGDLQMPSDAAYTSFLNF